MSRRSHGLLMISLLALGTAAHAKELHVDAARGDDSVSYANNSSDRPWRSVGRAVWGSTSNTSPNTGEAARAGDVVIVAAGTYETSAATGERYHPIYNPANSGSAGSPITFRAATPGSVSLRSTQSSNSQPIIGAFGRNHIVWDGFNIDEQYVPTRRDTGPVVVWDANNVTLQNLVIRGYNRGWTDNHNGIRLESVDNITIRNNLITGYREDQGMNASAITMYRTRTAVVENNEIVSASAGVFVKGLIDGPVTVRNNLIRDVQYGILFGGVGTTTASNGAVARNNIIRNAWAGIGLIGYDNVSPQNVTIAHNTIVSVSGGDGGAVLFRPGYGGYRNIRVSNNILARARSAITIWENQLSQIRSDYNAFFENTTVAEVAWSAQTLLNWQTQYRMDTVGSRLANPGFVNESGGDFHLSSSSPLLMAGLDILDLDRDGSVTDAVAMGAYATGNEVIGRNAGPVPAPPTAVSVQ